MGLIRHNLSKPKAKCHSIWQYLMPSLAFSDHRTCVRSNICIDGSKNTRKNTTWQLSSNTCMWSIKNTRLKGIKNIYGEFWTNFILGNCIIRNKKEIDVIINSIHCWKKAIVTPRSDIKRCNYVFGRTFYVRCHVSVFFSWVLFSYFFVGLPICFTKNFRKHLISSFKLHSFVTSEIFPF